MPSLKNQNLCGRWQARRFAGSLQKGRALRKLLLRQKQTQVALGAIMRC